MRLVPVSDRGRLLLAIGTAFAVVLALGLMWWASLIPDTYDVEEMGCADYGGGPVPSAAPGHAHHGTAVADLVETRSEAPDQRITLTVHDDGSAGQRHPSH